MAGTLVQFGAGNIGRSFIGQLFSLSGYEVVFIDINDRLVAALNENRRYRVIIKRNDQPDETITVRNVRAVHGSKREAVIEEIVEAAVISTSVGKGALPHIFPVMAEGLVERYTRRPDVPIDIIIAENIRNGAAFLQEEIGKQLPGGFPLVSYIGFVETSIGKMVPIMREEDIEKDPLWVFAEEYNTLIVDKKGFKNPIPSLKGLKPVQNIRAYVDRKLFIHNLGHAAAAYHGYRHNPSATYIWEPLQNRAIYAKVKTCMLQAAEALNREYPNDLAPASLRDHIDDLLFRFQNRSLGDTIFRVGRDLYRKLGRNDRIIGAVLLARKHGLPANAIEETAAAAVDFRAKNETGELYPTDADFVRTEYPSGIEHILQKVSKLSPDNPLEAEIIKEIAEIYRSKT